MCSPGNEPYERMKSQRDAELERLRRAPTITDPAPDPLAIFSPRIGGTGVTAADFRGGAHTRPRIR